MKAKSSGETINVNGPDGPTSVLIFDRNKKLSFRQKFQKFKVQTKRKFFEKRIKLKFACGNRKFIVISKYGCSTRK